MAKRSEAPVPEAEVKAVDTPVDTPVNVDPEVKEPVIDDPATDIIPVGACDPELWGKCDLNSKACKSCEVFEGCKVKTAENKPAKRTAAASGTPRVKRVTTDGLSKFNLARIGTRSSDLDAALEEFKTYQELAAIFTLSTVKAHIKWLQAKRSDRCHLVTAPDGRIRMELNEGVA